jgi:hypothetical protein
MTFPVADLPQRAPASWYRESGNPGVLRWWDGERWTEHRAPDPAFATRPAPVVSRSRRVDGPLLGAGAVGVLAAVLGVVALRLPLNSGIGPSVDMWTLRTVPTAPGDFWKALLLGVAIAAVAGILLCVAAAGRGSPLGRRVGAWGLVLAALPLAWTVVMAGSELSDLEVPDGMPFGWGAAMHVTILAAALAAGAGVVALVRDHRVR